MWVVWVLGDTQQHEAPERIREGDDLPHDLVARIVAELSSRMPGIGLPLRRREAALVLQPRALGIALRDQLLDVRERQLREGSAEEPVHAAGC
jgi:hypothetical protein